MKKRKAGSSRSSKRNRFKRAQDAHEQLRQIENAQKESRSGKNRAIIESIEKSQQRFRNELRNIQSLDDAYEQFDS